MITLLHGGLEPLIYGVVIFLGLYSMWHKLKHGRIFAFGIEAGVFWLVFTLHGGSMTGGFAATIAALLAGVFLPFSMRKRR